MWLGRYNVGSAIFGNRLAVRELEPKCAEYDLKKTETELCRKKVPATPDTFNPEVSESECNLVLEF